MFLSCMKKMNCMEVRLYSQYYFFVFLHSNWYFAELFLLSAFNYYYCYYYFFNCCFAFLLKSVY